MNNNYKDLEWFKSLEGTVWHSYDGQFHLVIISYDGFKKYWFNDQDPDHIFSINGVYKHVPLDPMNKHGSIKYKGLLEKYYPATELGNLLYAK